MIHEESERLREIAFHVSKKNVFAALSALTVKTLHIRFDGYADSGQVDEWEIELECGDDSSDPDLLPTALVERLSLRCGQVQPERSQILLTQAVEELCYDLLDENYSGWGNNDGSYGTFVFDVENGTLTLEHNRRSVETTTVEA